MNGVLGITSSLVSSLLFFPRDSLNMSVEDKKASVPISAQTAVEKAFTT